jgi:hypothetical protein
MLVVLGPKLFAATYLPLVQGNTWNLASGSVSMRLTVTSSSLVDGVERATVQVDNPWLAYAMLLRSTAQGILLEGIAFHTGRYGYPNPVVMFGEGAVGQTWSSPFLNSTLVSSSYIKTPLGSYQNVLRYDIAFGSTLQTWFLAPDVGFVQFGTTFPLLLTSQTLYPLPAQATPSSASCPLVGLQANPPANGDFSPGGKEQALRTAIGTGANFMTISTSWQDLEPHPGVYDFSSISDQLSWAQQYQIETALILKTIDTDSTPIPVDLQARPWNDPILISRWNKFLIALANQLNSYIRWVDLGNEVDTYLGNNPAQLTGYYQFLQAGVSQLHYIQPRVSTGVVFSFDSYHLIDGVFRVLSPLCSHISFTYYDGNPLAGVSQRSPADVAFDLGDMISAANGRPLVLTEVGYSSSTAISSSQQLQATFYTDAFAAFSNAGGKLTAASFAFMSDFPASVSASLAGSYGNASGYLFASWIGNLGLLDPVGNPKLAWAVFETEAPNLHGPLACKAAY